MALRITCSSCGEKTTIRDDAPPGLIYECSNGRCNMEGVIERNGDIMAFSEGIYEDDLGKYFELSVEADERLKNCTKCDTEFEIGERVYLVPRNRDKVDAMCDTCRKKESMLEGMSDSDVSSGQRVQF